MTGYSVHKFTKHTRLNTAASCKNGSLPVLISTVVSSNQPRCLNSTASLLVFYKIKSKISWITVKLQQIRTAMKRFSVCVMTAIWVHWNFIAVWTIASLKNSSWGRVRNKLLNLFRWFRSFAPEAKATCVVDIIFEHMHGVASPVVCSSNGWSVLQV